MSGTTVRPEGITNPPIDVLVDAAGSKYQLVIYAAKRAREINAYYSQLDSGALENVGPLVTVDRNEKPMSIALREIQAGRLEFRSLDADEAAALDAVVAGNSFGELCELLAARFDPERAAVRAAGWLRRWVEEGLIAAVTTDSGG